MESNNSYKKYQIIIFVQEQFPLSHKVESADLSKPSAERRSVSGVHKNKPCNEPDMNIIKHQLCEAYRFKGSRSETKRIQQTAHSLLILSLFL